MLLHQLIIPVFLFPLAVVSLSAVGIVPANQALQEQTESVIDDVDQEDVVEDVLFSVPSMASPPSDELLANNHGLAASPQRFAKPRRAN